MNFYKRFIGDIQSKTGGLTLAEFGAYDRLLDHYYSTELPVPADEVYRICRAMSGAERTAVDKVLVKFFTLEGGGYSQSKADELIAKAQPLIEAARENGKKGGRPKKPKTQPEPSGFEKGNPAETQPVKASQSQSQNSPSLRSGEASAEALGVTDQMLADWIVIRKARKVGKLTPTAVQILEREAQKAGLTTGQAIEACCLYSWGGFNAQWFAERKPKGGTGKQSEPEWRTEQRQRTQQAAPGVAAGAPASQFFIDVDARPVGVPALPGASQ